MKPTIRILYRVVVKPFYKQNAGLFLFIIIMLFGIVNELDGADIFDYHFSLITGMLTNFPMFGLVCLLWLIYAYKCSTFVIKNFLRPENIFLYVFSLQPSKKLFCQLLLVQSIIFLPVSLYGVAVICVAFHERLYAAGGFVFIYMLLICFTSACWYVYHLQNWGKANRFTAAKKTNIFSSPAGYSFILLRYLINKQKLLLPGFKIYNCGILYLILRNFTAAEYDIATPFIFFSFGVLGHGVLIYQLRNYEEQYLFFYRALPLSLTRKFLEYVLLYGILLIPEIIVIVLFTSRHLLLKDAANFILSGYTLLLLLNSILLYHPYKMSGYVRLSFIIFCVICLLLMIHLFYWLPIISLCLAVFLFARGYYHFEKKNACFL